MNQLSFQVIREDIAPTIEKIDTFAFISGEARTIALQLLNAYNQKANHVPSGTTVTICLPTADTGNPIIRAMVVDALDQSVVTAALSIIDTTLVISGNLLVVVSTDASGSVKATGTVTINDNSFDSGDSVTIDGTELVEGTDWSAGVDTDASATNLATAINALTRVSASAVGSVVTITAIAFGESGNQITMTETDTGTDNFTLSGSVLSGGDFGTDVLKSLKRSLLTRTKAD